MLTLNQIIKLYESGLEIKIKNKSQYSYQRGFYENSEIYIYKNNTRSVKDKEVTILHELIHARNHLLNNRYNENERNVQKEALDTYKKRPHIISFVKNIFNLE